MSKPVIPPQPIPVFTLAIDHKFGADITVHATEQKALGCLDDDIRRNWASDLQIPMPNDHVARLKEYFEPTEQNYEIKEHELRF
jgi:hypothetical protein